MVEKARRRSVVIEGEVPVESARGHFSEANGESSVPGRAAETHTTIRTAVGPAADVGAKVDVLPACAERTYAARVGGYGALPSRCETRTLSTRAARVGHRGRNGHQNGKNERKNPGHPCPFSKNGARSDYPAHRAVLHARRTTDQRFGSGLDSSRAGGNSPAHRRLDQADEPGRYECRDRDSNPDAARAAGDFKSPASASSAIPASRSAVRA